jgi:hypothetical protein
LSGQATFVHMGIEGRLELAAQGTDLAERNGEPSNSEAEWLRVDHPASPFGDWRAWFASMRVLCAEKRGAGPTWVVRLLADEGVSLDVWVDAETGDTLFDEYDQPVAGGTTLLACAATPTSVNWRVCVCHSTARSRTRSQDACGSKSRRSRCAAKSPRTHSGSGHA